MLPSRSASASLWREFATLLRRSARSASSDGDAGEVDILAYRRPRNRQHQPHRAKGRRAPRAQAPRVRPACPARQEPLAAAFTRDQILERLWGHDYYGDSRTVDVHVRWLREKIEPEPSKPVRIVTIRGVGYRFDG